MFSSFFILHEPLSPQAVEVIERHSGSHQDPRLLSQRTEAFLSLARFSDMQYQAIDKHMNSSEFENKQALLKKAKEEVGLIREHKVVSNRSAGKQGVFPKAGGPPAGADPEPLLLLHRYTTKVQKELELDEKALSNLQADRQRFLCKAVENYVQCLEEGEEHDTWVFRLASLWLENGDVGAVNATMKVSGVMGRRSVAPCWQAAHHVLTYCSPERSGEGPLPQVPASDVSASCSHGDKDDGRGRGLPRCPLQCRSWTVLFVNEACPAASPVLCPRS